MKDKISKHDVPQKLASYKLAPQKGNLIGEKL